MDKKITPVIKSTRTKVEHFDVCPHCMKEIMEKSMYVDPDNFEYHRPCQDKGPIGKLEPMPFAWGRDGVIRLGALADAIKAAVDKPKATKKAVITRSQWERAGQKAGWLKTAQFDDDDNVALTATFKGYFDMNVAGRDWEFEYSAKISGEPDSDRVEVEQPDEMPDDLWGQVWEQVEDRAREVAEARYLQKVGRT